MAQSQPVSVRVPQGAVHPCRCPFPPLSFSLSFSLTISLLPSLSLSFLLYSLSLSLSLLSTLYDATPLSNRITLVAEVSRGRDWNCHSIFKISLIKARRGRPSFLWPSTVYGLIPTNVSFVSLLFLLSLLPCRMRRLVSFTRGLINTIPVIVLSSSWREFFRLPSIVGKGEGGIGSRLFSPSLFSFPLSLPNVLEWTKKMGRRILRIFFFSESRERETKNFLQTELFNFTYLKFLSFQKNYNIHN